MKIFMTLTGVMLLFAISFPQSAHSLEIDPYLGWMVEIEDGSSYLNKYINGSAEETVNKINNDNKNTRKNRRRQIRRNRLRDRYIYRDSYKTIKEGFKPKQYTCSEVAVKIYKEIHTNLFFSQNLIKHLRKNPEVEKYRGPEDSFFKAVWYSYLRYIPQIYLTSLSYVYDFGGIRIGDDKLGHFFGYGRRYLKKYRKYRKKGYSEEKAVSKTIKYGIKMENSVVGKAVDGVFSHADLEANYQGFRMLRNFCEGDSPYLTQENNQWVWNGADIMDYLNPAFDEVYNNSHFGRPYWKLVKKRLKNYCPLLNDPVSIARLEMYEKMDKGSLSREMVTEYLNKRDANFQQAHSLQHACDADQQD